VRRLAARQTRRHWREQIAAVKTRRQSWGLPGNLPNPVARGAAQHDLEEAVIGPDIAPPVGLDDQRAAVAADPGTDNSRQYRPGGEPPRIRGEQIGRR